MRITNFLYSTIYRFAPMSDKDSAELEKDAMQSYGRILQEAKDIRDIKIRNEKINSEADAIDDQKKKDLHLANLIVPPKETILHKLAILSEGWIFRTFLAIFHIWLIPQIQAYQNGTMKGDDDDENSFDDHDEDDDFVVVRRKR